MWFSWKLETRKKQHRYGDSQIVLKTTNIMRNRGRIG